MTAIDNFSAAYSKYYDLLNAEKPYAEEATFVTTLLAKHRTGTRQLLELGVGTANHAKYWCHNGYTVTGIERSESMCEIARSKQIHNLTVINGNMASFRLPDQTKFDAAVALFHVVSYLTTNEEILNCFRCVNHHLQPNGLFLFDAWYTPGVLWQRPESRIREMANETISVRRQAQATVLGQQDIVLVDYDIEVTEKASGKITHIREEHPMRHFSIPFVELAARQTGFRLVDVGEMITGAQPSTNVWAVYFLLLKESTW